MYLNDGVNLMRKMGLEPDPWQRDVLENRHPRLLLNCCRQAGKSTVVAALALAEAIFIPGTTVLLVSRSFRQASELFRKIKDFHFKVGEFLKYRRNANELVLKGNSRIVCLPCKEETIRGFSGVDLLLLDEAARIPDDLYRAVRPMLAVSGGRMICLSTPYGKRGFYWDAWEHGGDDWARIQIAADQLPRIDPKFLESERRGLGESWYIAALSRLCKARSTRSSPAASRPAPSSSASMSAPSASAASTSAIATPSPPSGACSTRTACSAVNARIESSHPNLFAEVNLYRYSDKPAERNAEIPIDEDNHALAALRYLIASIDERHLVDRPAKPAAVVDEAARQARLAKAQRDYLWNNPACWGRPVNYRLIIEP
jgi:Terminase large subunit, T4likevirus-type, N-terminal